MDEFGLEVAAMLASFGYAKVEIERKFLVKEPPPDLGEEYVRVIDIYIPETRMRVRRMEKPDGAYMIGKLGQKYQDAGQSVLERMMTSMYLNEAEYALFANFGGPQLVKRRYSYEADQRKYTLDVFEGDLAGLVLCEVEGLTLEEVQNAPMPSFAVREVTEDEAYSGFRLAQMTRERFLAWVEGEI